MIGDDSSMEESISVVTVTRERPTLLRRAMASVYAQDFVGEIEHVIVIDDDPGALVVIDEAPTRPGLRIVTKMVRRPAREIDARPADRRSGYPRLARLLNIGARTCSTAWVAVLDDDNAYEPGHLSSLLECAKANRARAVHSGRQLFWADGSPYLDEKWHTVEDLAEATRIYDLMCDRGVRVRGTNILLDRADPISAASSFRPSSVVMPEDPVFLVDENVWLLRRELLLEVPVPEIYSEEDYQNNTAPDDKFLKELLIRRVPIYSTGQSTVRYYLGGMSNNRTRARGSTASTG
ncbi:MAG: glycosyltransferase [Streptosporangiaceae bacterium]|nr:glycosyltransferase [Streptosporangiaceae bacterium]